MKANHQLQYMVVDPFKLDYSPAKIRVDSEEAQKYLHKFKQAADSLRQGILPL